MCMNSCYKSYYEHIYYSLLSISFQSAYGVNHSTETTLVHTLNTLLLASNSGKISLLTLFDLSAAFDTIDYSILLSRLQKHLVLLVQPLPGLVHTLLTDSRQSQ